MPKNTENKSNTISHADSIKKIRRGSIVCRCCVDKAHYYKVTDILDECFEPIVARQSKTLVLVYIGAGARAVENCKQTIYYVGDLMPFFQVQYLESESADSNHS